jgi:hypothetical protein
MVGNDAESGRAGKENVDTYQRCKKQRVSTFSALLRWHCEFVALHWDINGRRKNVRRPPVPKEPVELALKAPNRFFAINKAGFRVSLSYPVPVHQADCEKQLHDQ